MNNTENKTNDEKKLKGEIKTSTKTRVVEKIVDKICKTEPKDIISALKCLSVISIAYVISIAMSQGRTVNISAGQYAISIK